MATRTVRDCDRCGQRDICDPPLWRMLCTGKRDEIDLCMGCRSATFEYLLSNTDERGWSELVGELKNIRETVAKSHGATLDDMRP